MLIAVLIEAN